MISLTSTNLNLSLDTSNSCEGLKSISQLFFNLINLFYIMIARPFLYKTQNFICLFNEIILQICWFLMFGFFGDGKPKDGIGIAMIVLFSFNIIVCFTLSFVLQIYLCCSKRKPDTLLYKITFSIKKINLM